MQKLTTQDIASILDNDAAGRSKIHNVRLIDARESEGGTLMVFECDGATHELLSAWPWGGMFSDSGKIGYLHKGYGNPGNFILFTSYLDQSLRRAPQYDSAAANPSLKLTTGWVCDAKPGGFRAPQGIIPGEGGRFISDETVPVTVRVPQELLRLCSRVQGMCPERLIEGFLADLLGLQSALACPRADGFCSNGSDERMLAQQWFDRTYGMITTDEGEFEDHLQEQQEQEYEDQDLLELLHEFKRHGGSAETMLSAAQTMLDQQIKDDYKSGGWEFGEEGKPE